jgi:hypothetical protein
MKPMSTYRDLYAGHPAAVLGGGPSLPGDMEHLPADCLLIAVNHHAFAYCKPDFMVYNDDPKQWPDVMRVVKEHQVVLVSPEPSSDILFDVDVWTGFFSSNTAAWFALWMGCTPVILCGHDLYQGPVKHCNPTPYDDNKMLNQPLDFYFRPWEEEARARCPHPERMRAMSGPLVSLFGQYEAQQ